MSRILPILAALMAVSAAAADDFVIIRASVPETVGLSRVPVLASTDAAGLREALGIETLPQGALYAEEMPGDRPVEMQIDVTPDGRAQFAGLLSPNPAGPREIRVWLRNAPETPPAPPVALAVARLGQAARVEGAGFSVLHDPGTNAGLLSEIEWRRSGKTFRPNLNDRAYSKQIGGFYLRHDPEPDFEVVAEGPYMAEVRVSARYVAANGAAPPSQPRATYAFRYWAGLPVIGMEARMAQDEPFAWDELHVLELHFKDDSFGQFALGAVGATRGAPTLQDFIDSKQGTRSPTWGALTDGESVLGLTGSVLVYDGQSDYGRYLHGPWDLWTAPSVAYSRWLYVGAGVKALDDFATIASGRIAAQAGALLTEGLAQLLGRLHERATASSDRAQAGRLDWRVALIETAAVRGAPLGRVRAAAEALQAALQTGTWRQFLPDLPGGRLLLADDGQLGVALRLTDTGVELASLYDLVTHREMLGEPAELFMLALTDAEGAPASLGSRAGWERWEARGTSDETSANITARFEHPAAEDLAALQVDVTCDLSGGESRWRLAVTNDSAWSIDLVTTPALSVAPLGESARDDTLYVPNGYGREYSGGVGARFRGYYPSGSCALPLLLVSDDSGGLYLAAHDPGSSTRDMVSDSAGDAGIPLRIETPAPDASVAGNDFATAGEIVIARVDGGWYPAMQKYRAWLQANAPWWPEGDPDYGRPDRPAWLDNVGAWVLFSGGPETVLPPTQKFAEFMGLPTAIHWYNWHQIPFDDDYPHYFPTKEGFAEGVATLQAQGVRIVPYINGRLWDTDTESFQTEAHRYCTRDRAGEPYIEVYGSGQQLAPMCIATQFWRDTLHEIVMRLMTEVKVDGVYMDQIAAARPRLCYDRSHGHPLAGGNWWTAGYWELLERIQTDSAQVSADKMLTTESNAESYARWFDTYLMCNSLGDGLVPLFPAVYGSKILGFGRYMERADWDDPQALAQKQGQLFVWGTQLWWSQPGVVDHEFAGPWLRDLARLRYRVREFFNAGRMLPPPVLEGNDSLVHADWHRRDLSATTPAVLATVWGLADGRLLVPLINCSEDVQSVTLVFDPRDYGLGADATFTVQRLGPVTGDDLGAWRGPTRHEIELTGVEAAALVLTPAQ